MAQKYMIEGEWSGYRSSQQRVVHRHFTTRKAEADRVRKIGYGITFTDGTMLYLKVKEVSGRGLPKPIDGYRKLIDDCAYYGVCSVDQLVSARQPVAAKLNAAEANHA